MFFSGAKTVGAFLHFLEGFLVFRGIFVFFRGDFNMIYIKINKIILLFDIEFPDAREFSFVSED